MGLIVEEPIARPGAYPAPSIKYDIDLLSDHHRSFAQVIPHSEQQFANRDDLAALADRVRDLETAHLLRGRL